MPDKITAALLELVAIGKSIHPHLTHDDPAAIAIHPVPQSDDEAQAIEVLHRHGLFELSPGVWGIEG